MAGIDEKMEAEVDPRTAEIMRKMRIFAFVSIATMAIGFLSVMSVIAWRLVKQNENAPAPEGELQGVLPIAAGSRITGTTSDGKRLFITVETQDGRQMIQVFDATTLAYRGRIETLTP